jgi:acetyltransferase-like isoleucine patch superfamily enzyme
MYYWPKLILFVNTMSLHVDKSSYIIEPYTIISHDSRKSNGELPNINIGKMCSIGINLTLCLGNHFTNRISSSPSSYSLFSHGQGNLSSYSKGDIIIKNDVWIGANVSIIDGTTISNGAVIGIGAVVTKSVPPYAIVGGNPAKIIKYRFSEDIINRLEALNFWDLSIEDIKKFDIWSDNIEEFINNVNEFKLFKDSLIN